MADLNVTVQNSNNLNVEVTPTPIQTIQINRGVSGVGIESVSIVYEDPYYYLDFQYTNGTNELVQLPAIAAGVVSFNTRVGVVTLESTDVTDALGYTPPEPDGTGATGTWNISVTGNAATVTNGVYTTGTYSDPLWITALAGSKITGDISGNAANVNGTVAIAHGGTGASTASGARANLNAADQATTISAGTGLSGGGDLSANRTISIANTGVTAASYGAASETLTATVNAQGQLTNLAATSIAIANTQVSGLGTMSTQNANNVSITGGSITGITDLAVADGGTGASTAADARTNLGAAASATTISAGTGLSGGGDLSENRTISIANTGVTAASYGAASKTLTATVNAQGQLTNLAETPIAIANTQVSGLGTASTLNAGVANGVATLDSAGTVPLSQINPALIGSVSYQGTWNASTNTPTLTSSVGTKGYYYVVSVAGSTNLNGITNWNIGDWAIFDGSSWGKVDNTDSVTSVNGYTGAVVLSYSDVGAPSTSGANATGTWGISVSGNAGTVTNGVYTTDVGTVTNTMLAGSIANNKLANSTISGVSLGSNLNALTIGSGLSGTNYDGSAAVTITNTAPDQIVSLTGGTGISTSGTYPNFTITNTAPDQIVSLTGAGTTSISGSYPNFTITSNDAYTGTVTSVGTGTGLTGGPITTTGTISFSNANVGTWAATPSSANLAAAMTDETGSGSLVFANSPTLSAPTIDGANPYIQFNNGAAVTLAAGRMWYDGATGSWNLGMGGGNITQQVGEEQFIYGKASSAITEGQLIVKTGTVGASGVITFGPSPTGLTVNDGIIGVATENIASGSFGRITTFGVVHGINTTGSNVGETWADNDTLYYNPNYVGGLTNVKPTAPNIKYEIATVINAGNGGSGSIQVNLLAGSTLGGTDSNVQFGTLSSNDLIQYNGTYWTNITPGSLTGVGSVANSLTFNNSGTGDASGSTFNGSAAKTLSYNSIGAQPTLVSGTNIKTVNGTSLLGSGDLGTIGIGYGGTGQTTANAAFNALAPSQTGNAGKYLTTDGSNTSWATNPLGTVTSVSGTGTVSGITLTGTVTTSGDLTLGGSLDLSSPPAIGGTSPNSAAFTTLTTSSTVTLNGGTANGVAYLNGSKVLTTGSALTFDGTNLTNNAGVFLSTSATGGNGYVGAIGTGMRLVNLHASSNIDIIGNGGINLTTAGNYPFAFSIAGSEQMRLTSTGLGIGTSSPQAKLHVNGAMLSSGALAALSASSIFVDQTTSSISRIGAVGPDASTYGTLRISQYSSNGALGRDALELSPSGNLGLGVTPSAWQAGHPVFETVGGSFYGYSSNVLQVLQNAYFNGTNYIYKNSTYAGAYNIVNGAHTWQTATSGTAGNAISFTQAMTLDASGNLLVGATSNANGYKIYAKNNNTSTTSLTLENNNGGYQLYTSNQELAFYQLNVGERMRIDSSGNVGIGVTPSAWATYKATQVGWSALAGYAAADTAVFSNAFFDGGYKYIGNGFASQYRQINSAHQWFTAPSGTAGNAITFTQAMTLDASGSLGIAVTNPSAFSAKLVVDGNAVLKSGSSLAFYNPSNSAASSIYNNASSSSNLVIETGGSERMRIDSSGNVGIGTSSPTSRLHVTRSTQQTNIDSADQVLLLENTSTDISGNLSGLRFRQSNGTNAANCFLGMSSTGSSSTRASLIFAPPNTSGDATERMRIDSSGNVGIGVTPSAWGGYKAFDVLGGSFFGYPTNFAGISSNAYNNGSGWKYKATAVAGMYQVEANAHAWYTAPSGTAGNAISFTQAMTLDASGNLQVGATSNLTGGSRRSLTLNAPSGQLSILELGVNGTLGGYLYSNAAQVTLTSSGATPITLETNGSERMRIDSSGNLLVGTTNTSVANGAVVIQELNAINTYIRVGHKTGSASGADFLACYYNETQIGGVAQNGTTGTSFNTTSDYRLKENIQPMQNALAVVAQLNPVTYTWKADGSDGQGFIAHELQAVVPDCVTGEKDAVDAEGNPVYQGIDTSFLVATLTKAIQEQQQLIESLTARVAQLEGK